MYNRFLNTPLQRSPAKKKKTDKKKTFFWVSIFPLFRLNKRIYVHRGVARTRQKSKMESFLAIVNNFESLTIITKLPILDVCRGRGYSSGARFHIFPYFVCK